MNFWESLREGLRTLRVNRLRSTLALLGIIGAVIAAELFDDQPAIGQMLRIGNVPFAVIAVLDKKGLGVAGRNQDDVVFVPLATTKGRLFGAVHGGAHQALDLIVVKAA